VRIPKPFAEGAGLQASTEVEVFLEKGELRIAPVRPRWELNQLLSKVAKGSLHPEVETGPTAGREDW
jgi:antitoxin component of MazEF toxin-antitoxin module